MNRIHKIISCIPNRLTQRLAKDKALYTCKVSGRFAGWPDVMIEYSEIKERFSDN